MAEIKPRYLVMVTASANNNKYYKQIPHGDSWTAEYGRVGSSPQRREYSMSQWESKYKEKHTPKQFNFSKYYDSATSFNEEKHDILNSFMGSPKFDTTMSDDDGPIKYNTTDAKAFIENDGAITYNINKNKK